VPAPRPRRVGATLDVAAPRPRNRTAPELVALRARAIDALAGRA
jgi:hypothetical protein